MSGVSEAGFADRAIKGLLVLSVAGVGLDEFNFSAGFFTANVSLLCCALAFCFYLARGVYTVERRALLFAAFIVTALISALLSVAVPSFVVEPVGLGAMVGKILNLMVLVGWMALMVRFFTPEDYIRAFALLLLAMLIKTAYILSIIVSGDLQEVYQLPSGLPRLALRRGGMTPNQTGAVWLTLFIFFFNAMTLPALFARRKYFPLAVALSFCLGIMSGSRCVLASTLCVLIVYAWVRLGGVSRFACVALAFGIALGYFAFQPDRLVDESLLLRLDFWGRSFENFSANPFLGSGFGSDPTPHNVVIQLLSEVGLIGFLLFGFFVVSLLFHRGRFMSRAFLLFVLPYSFFMMVDIGLLQWQTWLLLALSMSAGRMLMGSHVAAQAPGADCARASHAGATVVRNG